MIAKCKFCLTDFEAQRKTATFCSDLHRTLFGKLSDEEKSKKEIAFLAATQPIEKIISDEIDAAIEIDNAVNPTEFPPPDKENNGTQKSKTMKEKSVQIPKVIIDKERQKRIRETMEKINKDYGEGTIMCLGDKPLPIKEVISTGSLGLDKALGVGGLPRGRIVEIYGPESSGKTTIALNVIAQANKKGLSCALIDAEHSFDQEYAQLLGVNIDLLSISQPDYGEQALEETDRCILSGDFAVVVIDSVAALIPKAELEGEMGDSKMGLHARLMGQAMRKLTATISKTKTLCIFINQLRSKIGLIYPGQNPEVTTGGNALKFFSSIRLDVRKIGMIKDGEEIIGNKVKVKVAKSKVAPPFKVCEFDILYGIGIDYLGEIIDIASENGIIKKSGSWYSHKENKLGQGRESVRQLLKDNPELLSEIETELTKQNGKS